MISPLAGGIFFGANRLWTIAPFMICTFAAWILVLIRPFWDSSARVVLTPPGYLCLAGFSVYGLIHIFISPIPYEARADWIISGSCIASFWCWMELTPRLKRSRFVLGVALVYASGLAWYALIQHTQGSTISLWVDTFEFYENRATGTYICPNHFAQLLVMPVTLALVILFSRGFGVVLRILSGYALLVCIPAVLITLSRAGLVGLLSGFSIVILLMCWKRAKALFWICMALGPAMLAGVVFLIYQTSPDFRERLEGMRPGHQDLSVAGRLAAWQDTAEMIGDRWLVGHGAGSFRWAYLAYKSPSFQLWLRYTHNEYLQLFSDYGVIGGGLILAALAMMLRKLFQTYNKPPDQRTLTLVIGATGVITAALAHAVFDFTFHIYANVHFLVALLGVTFSAIASSGVSSPPKWKPKVHMGIYLACIILAGVWIVGSVQLYQGYALVERGDEAREQFDFDRALELYQKAQKKDAQYWHAWIGEGDVYRTKAYWGLNADEADEYMALALASYEHAFRLNPSDLNAVYSQGDLLFRRGYLDRAKEKLEFAVTANPTVALYRQRLGQLYREQGDLLAAREQFVEVIRLDPASKAGQAAFAELKYVR